MIAPIGLNLDWDVPVSSSLFAPWTTLAGALTLVMLLISLIWLAAGRKQPAAVWALGFFVVIAPSSSIVAQADMIYEHRTYLPMVCAVMALGFLIARIPRNKLAVGFAVLVPIMLAGTISRNAACYDEKTFWADVASKSPNKGRSWQGLARAYEEDPAKVRAYLARGLTVDPGNAELHTNYGIALLASEQPAEALAHFQRALALTEETADRWNNIGGAYFKLNDLKASMNSFRNALRLDPCNFGARRNVMMLYSQGNDPHGVWQAGKIPAACKMIPDQAGELDRLRRQAGTP
jgi:tetratricopeptide (TPR) repeat protein